MTSDRDKHQAFVLDVNSNTNMKSIGAEIFKRRGRGQELSQQQRDIIIVKMEAGCSTAELAAEMRCTRRCVQKTIQRYKETNSNATRPRCGAPAILTTRERRLIFRIVRKTPNISYRKLLLEAGLWPQDQAKPRVSEITVKRALRQEGLRVHNSKVS